MVLLKQSKNNGTILLLLGVILLVLAIALLLASRFFPGLFGARDYGVLKQSELIEVPYESLSADTLFITEDRKEYVDGSMRLIVPALSLDTFVGADTVPEALKEMPGLYEYSQLPSSGDVNVSIAGHRDIGHLEFYALDTLSEGDYLYLIYQGNVFQYEFYTSKIVEADDWSVIKRQGFSALTLTTCDPIGTRRDRLVVTGALVSLQPEEAELQLPISK